MQPGRRPPQDRDRPRPDVLPGPAHHRADAGAQLPGPERLCQEVISSGMKRRQGVEFVGSRRQHDHVRVAELPDPAQHLETVDIGKPDIQGDHARLPRPDDVDPFTPAGRRMNFEACLAQYGFDKVPDIFVVFYYDGDSQIGHGPPTCVTLRCRSRMRRQQS